MVTGWIMRRRAFGGLERELRPYGTNCLGAKIPHSLEESHVGQAVPPTGAKDETCLGAEKALPRQLLDETLSDAGC